MASASAATASAVSTSGDQICSRCQVAVSTPDIHTLSCLHLLCNACAPAADRTNLQKGTCDICCVECCVVSPLLHYVGFQNDSIDSKSICTTEHDNEEGETAVAMCEYCEALCQQCLDNHKRMKATKTHKTTLIKRMDKQVTYLAAQVASQMSGMCAEHNEPLINVIGYDPQTATVHQSQSAVRLLCAKCPAPANHTCSIQAVVQSVSKELNQMANKLKSMPPDRTTRQPAEIFGKSAAARAETIKDQINKEINNLKNQFKEKMDGLQKELCGLVDARLATLRNGQQHYETAKDQCLQHQTFIMNTLNSIQQHSKDKPHLIALYGHSILFGHAQSHKRWAQLEMAQMLQPINMDTQHNGLLWAGLEQKLNETFTPIFTRMFVCTVHSFASHHEKEGADKLVLKGMAGGSHVTVQSTANTGAVTKRTAQHNTNINGESMNGDEGPPVKRSCSRVNSAGSAVVTNGGVTNGGVANANGTNTNNRPIQNDSSSSDEDDEDQVAQLPCAVCNKMESMDRCEIRFHCVSCGWFYHAEHHVPAFDRRNIHKHKHFDVTQWKCRKCDLNFKAEEIRSTEHKDKILKLQVLMLELLTCDAPGAIQHREINYAATKDMHKMVIGELQPDHYKNKLVKAAETYLNTKAVKKNELKLIIERLRQI